MEKLKLQKYFITKLLEKSGVTEKKKLPGVRQGNTGLWWKKSLENKTFEEFWKEIFSYVTGFLLRLIR